MWCMSLHKELNLSVFILGLMKCAKMKNVRGQKWLRAKSSKLGEMARPVYSDSFQCPFLFGDMEALFLQV